MTNDNSKEEKFNPFDLITGLLYYPSMGIGIRLGLAMYGVLFSKLTGFAVVFGVLGTIVIAIIFGMLAVLPAYFLQMILEYIWNWFKKRKGNQQSTV